MSWIEQYAARESGYKSELSNVERRFKDDAEVREAASEVVDALDRLWDLLNARNEKEGT